MAPLLVLLLLAGDPSADTTAQTAVDLQEPTAPASEVQEPPAPAPEAPAQATPPPAQEEPKSAEPPKPPPVGPPPPHTGVKATLKAIPGDFTHLPTGINLGILGFGGVAALAVHTYDESVNSHLSGSKSFFYPGKLLGSAPGLAVISLGTYAFGRATDNRTVSHLGMDLLRSAAVSGVLTYAVKLSVRRHRPAGGGFKCCSFPSGHASSTFALASVLWRHLGWKAAVPTYTVATYVALSRLHEDVHFLSDVVFGAAIGIVSGRAVVHHDRHFYGMRIQPMPVPGGGIGVMVAGSFK
jgi:membrane-associated phospholipid phosphatase